MPFSNLYFSMVKPVFFPLLPPHFDPTFPNLREMLTRKKGLHLGPKGYKLMFEEFKNVMVKNWPEYKPYKMPFTIKVPWEIELGDQFWDVNNNL